MTKAELVKQWRESSIANNHTSAESEAMLDSLCNVIAAELLGGGEITLPHLGKLKIKHTAARKGRNPRTGEVIDIASKKSVAFVTAKALKDALN